MVLSAEVVRHREGPYFSPHFLNLRKGRDKWYRVIKSATEGGATSYDYIASAVSTDSSDSTLPIGDSRLQLDDPVQSTSVHGTSDTQARFNAERWKRYPTTPEFPRSNSDDSIPASARDMVMFVFSKLALELFFISKLLCFNEFNHFY